MWTWLRLLRDAVVGKKARSTLSSRGDSPKVQPTYTTALGDALAEVLHTAILAKRLADFEDEQKVDGLEDQLVNAVMKSSEWSLEAAWPVKKETHINLLEVDAVCKLASRISLQGGSTKAVALVGLQCHKRCGQQRPIFFYGFVRVPPKIGIHAG